MVGLRERQKVVREKRILESASMLFKRDGYDKTRMEDIADLAEVSTGTTYNYYESKADILIAVVSMEVEEILIAGKLLIEGPLSSVEETLNALVALYYEHSLVYLNKEMWRMAMSFSIQRPQTTFSQRYALLDQRISMQVVSLIETFQDKNMIINHLDHQALGEIIFNNLNSMFTEFVKSNEMTIDELKRTVARQMAPLMSCIIKHKTGVLKPIQNHV
jgi:AcrR family transcriptional regulator